MQPSEPQAPPGPAGARLLKRAARSSVALFTLLAWLGGRAAEAEPDFIEIDGNMVLVDEVYLAVLQLPGGAAPTADTAVDVERQILVFLRRAGYALAEVDARLTGNRIRV